MLPGVGRNRWHRSLAALLATLILLLAGGTASALEGEAARREYRAALADLYAYRLNDFEIRLRRLADYPLLPYLHYARLMRYISSVTPEEVADFRERWSRTPLADRALQQWLDNLAGRERWQQFRDAWNPDIVEGAALECHYHRALLETGATEEAFAGARRLWLVAESRPDACDPLFEAWNAAGGLDDQAAWQRLDMTLRAGQRSLASYLLRFLDGDSRLLGEQYLALHRSPHRLVRMTGIPGGDGGAREIRVVAHALERLAGRDADMAEAQLTRWSERLDFPPHERSAVREAIVRHAARQDRLPPGFVHAWPPRDLAAGTAIDLIEELARGAVRSRSWDEVRAWMDHLPEAIRSQPGWQYWTARAELAGTGRRDLPPGGGVTPAPAAADAASGAPLIEPPPPLPELVAGPAPRSAQASAEQRLAELAGQRNYYGFLAADRIDRPYALERAELDLTQMELEAVARHPAVHRALELRALGERPEARREMAWLMERLNDRELLALAEYARRIGWARQAISATIATGQWDHLDLRFPLAHEGPMRAQASARELQPSWLFAVARQESAFMSDARSSAGALGLMQILPSTARLTARRFDIPLASNWQLLDEEKNIQIGSTYLRQMYDRYDHNRILASAAYNAGPGRVDRWVRERDPRPADVWIESIPYRETRDYVQNVLAYALIYSMQLGQSQPFLDENER
jgi:soluble lytic murein transglycosylase